MVDEKGSMKEDENGESSVFVEEKMENKVVACVHAPTWEAWRCSSIHP